MQGRVDRRFRVFHGDTQGRGLWKLGVAGSVPVMLTGGWEPLLPDGSVRVRLCV